MICVFVASEACVIVSGHQAHLSHKCFLVLLNEFGKFKLAFVSDLFSDFKQIFWEMARLNDRTILKGCWGSLDKPEDYGGRK